MIVRVDNRWIKSARVIRINIRAASRSTDKDSRQTIRPTLLPTETVKHKVDPMPGCFFRPAPALRVDDSAAVGNSEADQQQRSNETTEIVIVSLVAAIRF